MLSALMPAARWLLVLATGLTLVDCRTTSSSPVLAYPADLEVRAVAGGVAPWSENRSLHLSPDGTGLFTRFRPNRVGAPPLARETFDVDPAAMERLWREILDHDFFSLDEAYADSAVRDGSFAWISVTADGAEHRVRVQNTTVPPFEAVLAALNAAVPEGLALPHVPPLR